MADEDEDGWLATAPTGSGGAGGAEEIGTMDDLEPEPELAPAVAAPAVGGSADAYATTDLSSLAAAPAAAAAAAEDDDDDDLDDMEDWDVMEDDDATLQRPEAATDDHIERTRTYARRLHSIIC